MMLAPFVLDRVVGRENDEPDARAARDAAIGRERQMLEKHHFA